MASNSVKLPSGDYMPLLGLGTFLSIDPNLTHQAILKALESGYRHIDTAYMYKNEPVIGAALQEAFGKGIVKREDVFIVTKLPGNGHHPDHLRPMLMHSLEKLKLTYIDLYLIHQPTGFKYIEYDTHFPVAADGSLLNEVTDHLVVWKEMEKLVDDGLVRNIGLSNFNSKQIKRIHDAARIKPANLQVECHPFFQQEKLFNFCKKLNISFTAYSPFGSPQMTSFVNQVYNLNLPEQPRVLEDPVLIEISNKYKKTPAQVVLRWVTQRGMITIPKSTTPARIEQNFQIFDFKLTDQEMSKIKGQDRGLRMFDFDILKGAKDHPEYPFKEEF